MGHPALLCYYLLSFLHWKETDVLCSRCAANLPDGLQFCPTCGQPASASASSSGAPPFSATLGCSRCGAILPADAQFCLKCGKPVGSPAKGAATGRRDEARPDEARPNQGPPDVVVLPPALPRARPKRRSFFWVLLVVFLLGLIVLVGTSDNPFAQDLQEMVGWKHDQTVLDKPFSVGPHTFRYYKFSLPEGSVNVAMVGQFSAEAESQSTGSHKDKEKDDRSKDRDKGRDKDKDTDKDSDRGVEVYVLTDAAFTVWQNGYATSSLYDSGNVPVGTVQTEIPAGAGIYYLVFSNKSSPKTAKTVHATVLLRYKSWLPEWFRRMKDRFWNWIAV
jgi:RNA polymerase subunit RPABC4/transcription elongation factor Spt4